MYLDELKKFLIYLIQYYFFLLMAANIVVTHMI